MTPEAPPEAASVEKAPTPATKPKVVKPKAMQQVAGKLPKAVVKEPVEAASTPKVAEPQKPVVIKETKVAEDAAAPSGPDVAPPAKKIVEKTVVVKKPGDS